MMMTWAPADRGWRTFMVRPKIWNIGMTERKLYWDSPAEKKPLEHGDEPEMRIMPDEGSKGALAQPEAILLVRQMVLVRLDWLSITPLGRPNRMRS